MKGKVNLPKFFESNEEDKGETEGTNKNKNLAKPKKIKNSVHTHKNKTEQSNSIPMKTNDLESLL